MQNEDVLVPANTGPPAAWKMAVKTERENSVSLQVFLASTSRAVVHTGRGRGRYLAELGCAMGQTLPRGPTTELGLLGVRFRARLAQTVALVNITRVSGICHEGGWAHKNTY